MTFIDILYITIAVAIVVITVTVVWLSNELIGFIKSVKRSSRDSEKVTKEIREKVMLVSESLDRAGQAASTLVGLIEDAIEGIKPRRERIADSLGIIAAAADYSRFKQAKENQVEVKKEAKEKGDLEKLKNKPQEKKSKEYSKGKDSTEKKSK